MSMQIKYTNFKDGIHRLDFEKSVDKLGLEQNFIGNVLLFCEMDKSSSQIVINCNLHLTGKMVCDRCTADFKREFEISFKNIYFFSHGSNQDEIDEDGIFYLSPADDKIDLSASVFENALLALPMKNLCSEDCKGLCPVCGVNRNEVECNCETEVHNPVWEPLLKLKGKLN
jgi:uncharacterized protein